jgi:hypothetical protein
MASALLPGDVTGIDDTSRPSSKADPAVINLMTPVTINAGTEVLVKCSRPIKLSLSQEFQVLIPATSPILLTAPTTMWLDRSDNLGPDFVRRWDKLPEEIKMHILSFNLVLEDREDTCDNGVDEVTLQDDLCSHLAMGPEIARLAYEVYYTQNVFLLLVIIEPMEWPLSLSPRPARPLIREVRVEVDFDLPY